LVIDKPMPLDAVTEAAELLAHLVEDVVRH
jgi:hypothetical protein